MRRCQASRVRATRSGAAAGAWASGRSRSAPYPHGHLPGRQSYGAGRHHSPNRRPELALVDELAHANLPGERHAKRWHDVRELLASTIDVYTTLNVGNIESLGALVSRITGVRPAEPVSDTFVRTREIKLVRPGACGASSSAGPGPCCSLRADRCDVVELFPLREPRFPAGAHAGEWRRQPQYAFPYHRDHDGGRPSPRLEWAARLEADRANDQVRADDRRVRPIAHDGAQSVND